MRYSIRLIPFLFALVFAACDANDPHIALGSLERDPIRLTAPASELITAVYVKEGDHVTRGTPLLQLDNTAAAAEVARISAELKQARAYLSQLESGARKEEIASAQARVDNAEATALAETKAYQRANKLVQQNLLGRADLDQALAKRDSARAALEDAREQLQLLLGGTRIETIEQARAQVEEAEQALVIADKHLADLEITATRSGRIDTLPWLLGERVSAGAVLAIILVDDSPYVRAYAPESVLAQLQIGRQLSVTLDGVAQPLAGTLIQVQKNPAFSPHYALTETERSRLMYLIKVKLDERAADLPGGLPAQVYFDRTPDDAQL